MFEKKEFKKEQTIIHDLLTKKKTLKVYIFAKIFEKDRSTKEYLSSEYFLISYPTDLTR